MDREEILANFQACTGIDDVAESILHLETADWNLIDAVNRVMPQETQTLPSESHAFSTSVPMETSPSIPMMSHTPPSASISTSHIRPVSASNDIIVVPSTSHPRTRTLHFHVEYGDRNIEVVVNDSETVGTMKIILHAESGIPPCRQELRGWKTPCVTDSTRLSSLNLPKENALTLLTPVQPPPVDNSLNNVEDVLKERINLCFKLHVIDKTNKKDYNLNFHGSKTISEVKQDLFTLTDIPVRHQVWLGWPEGVRDNSTLASTTINNVNHKLIFHRADLSEPSRGNTSKTVVVDLASDSSGEEFEDASDSFGIEDEMFMEEVSVKKLQPLMPENSLSDLDSVNHMISEFGNRYGENHAMFYLGTLDDALKEAFHRPAKERKLLAIYLHHDSSVLSNVFCTQLLCAETVSSYLTANFITWAWDLTFESNRMRLLGMVNQHFGSLAATTIRNFNLDQLPILLVIMRIRSTTEVFTVIHGNVSLDELLTRLIHAVEVFSGQQQLEIVEEDEREAREQVKREQDAAYEASLMADRAKEEARRIEEEQKQKVARQEELERERLEEERIQQEAQKTALRKSLESQLPVEPEECCSDAVSCIRVRLPTGEVITRRFLAATPLKMLLDFLTVQGYAQTEYKVLTSWPRKDLTSLDIETSLMELSLYPQETLTLEER